MIKWVRLLPWLKQGFRRCVSFESRYGMCDGDSFFSAAMTLPSADRDLLMCLASSCCCLLLSPSSFSDPARSTKIKLLTQLLSASSWPYMPAFSCK